MSPSAHTQEDAPCRVSRPQTGGSLDPTGRQGGGGYCLLKGGGLLSVKGAHTQEDAPCRVSRPETGGSLDPTGRRGGGVLFVKWDTTGRQGKGGTVS